ncbi:glycosyltransferase, partial [bacterium]|nr:glycosyltransferase [bacterium]
MPDKLKVVLFEPLGRGGICHYTFQLADNLAKTGIDVTLFTSKNYELNYLHRTFKTEGNLSLRESRLMKGLRQIREIRSRVKSRHDSVAKKPKLANIKRDRKIVAFARHLIRMRALFFVFLRRPHVVHFQWLLNVQEDLFFIRLLRSLRIKIFYTAHNLLPHDNNSIADRKAFQRIYETVDHIIVHAQENKRKMVQEFGIGPHKVSVIHHGNFELFYSNGSVPRKITRTQLKISENQKVILFFGLIRRYKGLEYLVDAFNQVRCKLNNAFLLIAGKIHHREEDSLYYSNLMGQLERDRVKWVEGYIPFEKVADYIRAS